MKKLHTPLAWMIGLCVLLAQAAMADEKLSIATDVQSPPWEMMQGAEISGLSVDIARQAFERAGIQFQFVAQSWLRAYEMALNRQQTCVNTAIRTPERESHFKWIGPIAVERWVLMGKADRSFAVTSLKDVAHYRVGNFAGDAEALYLRENGIVAEEVTGTDAYAINLKKLMSDRIDLWATGEFEGSYAAQKLGFTNLRPILVIKEGQAIYLACNPSVSDQIVERANAALQKMILDGSIETLRRTYLSDGP